jgi:isocitrate lyase
VRKPEHAAVAKGYTSISHQQDLGTDCFDGVTPVILGGSLFVTALSGSTDQAQF